MRWKKWILTGTPAIVIVYPKGGEERTNSRWLWLRVSRVVEGVVGTEEDEQEYRACVVVVVICDEGGVLFGMVHCVLRRL